MKPRCYQTVPCNHGTQPARASPIMIHKLSCLINKFRKSLRIPFQKPFLPTTKRGRKTFFEEPSWSKVNQEPCTKALRNSPTASRRAISSTAKSPKFLENILQGGFWDFEGMEQDSHKRGLILSNFWANMWSNRCFTKISWNVQDCRHRLGLS